MWINYGIISTTVSLSVPQIFCRSPNMHEHKENKPGKLVGSSHFGKLSTIH